MLGGGRALWVQLCALFDTLPVVKEQGGLIPGKSAMRLNTEDMVESTRDGSVMMSFYWCTLTAIKQRNSSESRHIAELQHHTFDLYWT